MSSRFKWYRQLADTSTCFGECSANSNIRRKRIMGDVAQNGNEIIRPYETIRDVHILMMTLIKHACSNFCCSANYFPNNRLLSPDSKTEHRIFVMSSIPECMKCFSGQFIITIDLEDPLCQSCTYVVAGKYRRPCPSFALFTI